MSSEQVSPDAIWTAASTALSMDELRQMSKTHRSSFFALIAKRLAKGGQPKPQEIRRLLNLLQTRLSLPALDPLLAASKD